MLVSAVGDGLARGSRGGIGVAVTRIVRCATSIGAVAASARFDEGASAALTRARAVRAQVAARDILGHHDVDLHVTGAPPQGPAIVVANHLSYLDPLLVLALVRAVAIAKADVAAWPVVGERLRELGVVYVKRGDAWSGARALREAEAALHAGVCVLNFPEGTTSNGRRVLPFRRGVFGLAARLGVPIVPTRISYDDPRVCWTDDAAFVPHYAWLARSPGIVARVRFGAPLTVTKRAARSPEAIAERARDAIARLAT
jgi:1-acyl-sn-glycerol-3-phosphate acyltransferase